MFNEDLQWRFVVGMGKTIMLSALIQTARDPEPPDTLQKTMSRRKQLRLDNAFRKRPEASTSAAAPSKGPSATLIVAPTSLLTQWHDELLRSSKPDTLKVLVWHGQNRLDLESIVDQREGPDGKSKGADVVITSYGTLMSEFSKTQSENKPSSPVFESKSVFCVYITLLSSSAPFVVEWKRKCQACNYRLASD